MTVGGLTRMIPGVSPALFAGSVIGVFMLQEYEKCIIRNGKDRILSLENDLFEQQAVGRLNHVPAPLIP
jgi:hypothetical protein